MWQRWVCGWPPGNYPDQKALRGTFPTLSILNFRPEVFQKDCSPLVMFRTQTEGCSQFLSFAIEK